MMNPNQMMCPELQPPELRQAVLQAITSMKYWLFFIPAVFLLDLVACRPLLYFPDLGLMVPRALVLMIAIPFVLFWLDHRPARQPGPTDFLPQLWHYLFPVSALSFVFFCQKYLLPGALLLAGLMVITVGYGIWLRRTSCEKGLGSFRQWIRKLGAFATALFAAALFLPGMFTVLSDGLQDPYYEARQELLLDIMQEAEANAETAAPADTSRNIPAYSPILLNRLRKDVWADLSTQMRLDTLQGLIGQACCRLGVPPEAIPTVQTELFLSDTMASFHVETGRITVDLRWLSSDDSLIVVKDVLHEVYHVFEHYIVTAVDWNDPIVQTALFDAPRAWREEMENYSSAWVGGYDSYARQKMEIDARNWTETEMVFLQSQLQQTL